ncbi:hypothetical protein H632_c3826p0, partial [Helicosporidium sp. ATCC 50920]
RGLWARWGGQGARRRRARQGAPRRGPGLVAQRLGLGSRGAAGGGRGAPVVVLLQAAHVQVRHEREQHDQGQLAPLAGAADAQLHVCLRQAVPAVPHGRGAGHALLEDAQGEHGQRQLLHGRRLLLAHDAAHRGHARDAAADHAPRRVLQAARDALLPRVVLRAAHLPLPPALFLRGLDAVEPHRLLRRGLRRLHALPHVLAAHAAHKRVERQPLPGAGLHLPDGHHLQRRGLLLHAGLHAHRRLHRQQAQHPALVDCRLLGQPLVLPHAGHRHQRVHERLLGRHQPRRPQQPRASGLPGPGLLRIQERVLVGLARRRRHHLFHARQLLRLHRRLHLHAPHRGRRHPPPRGSGGARVQP